MYLVLLIVGSIGFLASTALGAYGTGVSTVDVFRLVVFVVAGILAILGISKEKLWARWFAIAIYSLYIFLSIEGMVSSFSSEPALRRFNLIGSNTLIALRAWRIIMVIVSLVGIILLLKKPHMRE
ncbi:MAG: hypothetical protein HC936_15585 [Leptolyngbyaceae cyanobacterium SU_3_3]|nr:hypothetical protein [Leptolyngbyaceae cyanobacterium SU_3_3]